VRERDSEYERSRLLRRGGERLRDMECEGLRALGPRSRSPERRGGVRERERERESDLEL